MLYNQAISANSIRLDLTKWGKSDMRPRFLNASIIIRFVYPKRSFSVGAAYQRSQWLTPSWLLWECEIFYVEGKWIIIFEYLIQHWLFKPYNPTLNATSRSMIHVPPSSVRIDSFGRILATTKTDYDGPQHQDTEPGSYSQQQLPFIGW